MTTKLFHLFCFFIKRWATIGAVVIVLFTPVNMVGQPNAHVGGVINGNRFFTNDSTYIVIQSLVIPDKSSLTIGPGVKVRFNQGTGITVQGTLRVNGEVAGVVDSVSFLPNYLQPQPSFKWLGITFSKVRQENNFISHARISNAIVGIAINNESTGISITNSTISHSQRSGIEITRSQNTFISNCKIIYNIGTGIQLINSSNNNIEHCLISNNFDGVWLIANGASNACSGNILINNKIKYNSYWNLFLNTDLNGDFRNNQIEGNLIQGSFVGIQMGSFTSTLNGLNQVVGNILLEHGTAIVVHMDSTTVTNNIFWLNTDAILLNASSGCLVTMNSFFENKNCITVGTGSTGLILSKNTFSGTRNYIVKFEEAQQIYFAYNNFISNMLNVGVNRNHTVYSIDATNNWWGDENSNIINMMIWDKLDDPGLGLVFFSPVLSQPDTDSPISPPQKVIKQVVNNSVRVSWSPCPENDLNGYRVFSGNFENYRFPTNTEVGNEMSVILTQVSVLDPIAVTSFDVDGFGVGSQLNGNESPYSFAVLKPYAGSDASICKSEGRYYITQATAPNFETFRWSTSGDGTFDQPATLFPAYFPGSNDYLLGEVFLTLTAFINQASHQDSFKLKLLDVPAVYAGNDTIISPDSALWLNHASALHFDYLKWTSLGDGFFKNDTMTQAVYYPGSHDIENAKVVLVITASSGCGIARDTIVLEIYQMYSLSGSVKKGETNLTEGIVLAFLQTGTSYKATKTTSLNAGGDFLFQSLLKGKYLLYAIPDPANNSGFLPAYTANKTNWEKAHVIDLFGNTYDVDIQLPEIANTLPLGVGKIEGRFIEPETELPDKELYCSNWFTGKPGLNEYCQGGISNITILLFNHNKSILLGSTLTDEAGSFVFNKLPFGSYIITAEKAGYTSTPSAVIQLSPEHTVQNDIIITIHPYKILVSFNMGDPGSQPMVFPNPAVDWISVDLAGFENQPVRIEMLDVIGKTITTIDLKPSGSIAIPTDKLLPGFYFLRVFSEQEQTKLYPFMKQIR